MSYLWQVNSSARVVSRLATLQIGLPDEFYRNACNLFGSNGEYLLATPMKSETRDQVDEGFDIYRLNFAHKTMHLPSAAQGLLVLSGGVPACYDGERVSEYGFHIHPLISKFGIEDHTSGGDLQPDTEYTFIAIYTWLDSRGVRHRSWPSAPVMIKTSVAVGPHYVSFYVWNCTLTEREDPENQTQLVEIEIYRAGGTNDGFFHLDQIVLNQRYTPWTLVQSLNSDDLIEAKEVLYTEGGVLFDLCPPAAHHIAAHGDRLWLVSADNPEYLWISKIDDRAATMPGFPAEFIARTDVGDGVIAVASLDDKLVAFKSRKIVVYVGDPPNDAGVGGSLNGPTELTVQAGCIDARSVCACPAGVTFRGEDGLHLFTRGMTTQKISGPVEDHLPPTTVITSTICWEEMGVVLFTLDDGWILAWHYEANEWTTWYLESDGISLDCIASNATVATGLFNYDYTDVFSYAFWFRCAGDAGLFGRFDAGLARGWWAEIQGGVLGVTMRAGPLDGISAGAVGAVVADDNWHLAVVTYDGSASASGFRVYIDGALVTLVTAGAAVGVATSAGDLQLGAGGAQVMTGHLGPAGIWDRVLTQAEISAMQGHTWPDNPAGLWYAESIDDPYIYDRTPNSNTMRLLLGADLGYCGRVFPVLSRRRLDNRHAALCWRDEDDYALAGWVYTIAHHRRVVFAHKDYYGDADQFWVPTLVVSTPWLQLVGLQNYQRVRMVRLHGQWMGSHDLQLELSHDFEVSPQTVIQYDTAGVLGIVHDTREQVSIHVPRQRCESIKLKVKTQGNNRQVRWESIAFEVGRETGLKPLAIPARR